MPLHMELSAAFTAIDCHAYMRRCRFWRREERLSRASTLGCRRPWPPDPMTSAARKARTDVMKDPGQLHTQTPQFVRQAAMGNLFEIQRRLRLALPPLPKRATFPPKLKS